MSPKEIETVREALAALPDLAEMEDGHGNSLAPLAAPLDALLGAQEDVHPCCGRFDTCDCACTPRGARKAIERAIAQVDYIVPPSQMGLRARLKHAIRNDESLQYPETPAPGLGHKELTRVVAPATEASGPSGGGNSPAPIAPVAPEVRREESSADFIARLGMDGQKWAQEFMRLWGGHIIKPALATEAFDVDEALMVGWFCNAIMAGFDEAGRRSERRAAALEKALAELVACKDLKEQIESRAFGTTQQLADTTEEYERRKEPAWAAARAALRGGA